jgi:Glycosyl transferases group 1
MKDVKNSERFNRIVFVAKKGFHAFFTAFVEGMNEFEKGEKTFVFNPKGILDLNQNLETIVAREKATCLFILGDYLIDPEVLLRLKKDLFLVRVGGDDDWAFEYHTRWMAQLFDVNITTSKEAYERLHHLSYDAFRLIPPYRNLSLTPKHRFDISFIGRIGIKHGRNEYLEALARENLVCETFGKESKNGYLAEDEMQQVFTDSKINLNFSGIDSNKNVSFNDLEPDILRKKQLKARVFDIMQSGGFALTEHCRDFESLFDIGEELVTFKTPEEMVEKIKYYLTHENERVEILKKGQEKTRALYSYEAQFPKLISFMKNLKRRPILPYVIGEAGKRSAARILAEDTFIFSIERLKIASHFSATKYYLMYLPGVFIKKVSLRLKRL